MKLEHFTDEELKHMQPGLWRQVRSLLPIYAILALAWVLAERWL